MRRATPAQKKALTFLVEFISERAAEGERRLPGIRALAEGAKTSPVTIGKVIGFLRSKGIVSVSHRGGITIAEGVDVAAELGTPADHAADAQPHVGRNADRQKWQRVRTRIYGDILGGVFPCGTRLPGRKELTARYRVNERTLRKALTDLEDKGLFQTSGTHTTVAQLGLRAKRGVVLLVCAYGFSEVLEHYNPRTRELYRALESESMLNNIRLKLVNLEQEEGLEIPDDVPVYGALVWAWGLAPMQIQRSVTQLRQAQLPVAILNEGGNPDLHQGRGAGSPVLFNLGFTARPGEEVGHYLVKCGHRRVAYISHLHRTEWSRNRYEGLVRAFAEAGVDGSIPLVAFDFTDFRERPGPSALDPGGRPPVIEALAATLKSERERVELSIRYEMAFHRTLVREGLRPRLEQALRTAGVTAWVTANDDVGVTALEYLREHNRKVPEDMSVVGFDDSMEAFTSKLTSYNFNNAALARAMLQSVMTPRRFRQLTDCSGPVEVRGFVNERETVSVR